MGRRAVELARLREKPIARIAADLGIAGSCLHRWLRQADVDEGHREGLTSDEWAELVRLRRANRTLEMIRFPDDDHGSTCNTRDPRYRRDEFVAGATGHEPATSPASGGDDPDRAVVRGRNRIPLRQPDRRRHPATRGAYPPDR